MKQTIQLLTVTSSLKKAQFSSRKIKYLASICLEASPEPKWGLSIEICGNKEMKILNKETRNENKPTDIITLPINTAVRPGVFDKSQPEHCVPHYGSIVLNEPYIINYCKENKIDMNFYLPMLLVHGLCHAQHYDHETDEDSREMLYAERAMLRHLFTKIGYEPTANCLNLWSRPDPERKRLIQESDIDWNSLLNLKL